MSASRRIPSILTARFWKGVTGTDAALIGPFPHIVFVGRSNVGKSSVINSLIGTRVAYSSNKPGKTTELNLYMVEDRLLFVDIPGYGYAQLPEKQREKIRKMILWYLLQSEIPHQRIIHVIDAKVGPTHLDDELQDLLRQEQKPMLVVANKSDEIPKHRLTVRQKELETMLGVPVMMYSSKTDLGRDDLLREIY